ncbi:MAG: PKD-like family lipoprotein [Candidatus Pseudobacter hemicellulosilyticus]|uniref:PKD-like family lipoprotein n=1 Tax=Candidatus Pseudobacter hemicellulosilyticus TaxID=3121375 RepID=A0AAJ6BEL6_9BACT|nr:MAG: PKD-like family lipoprotein [Pseudobacter sp.]
MQSTYKTFLLALIAAICLLPACRKDESSMDSNKIPGVVIDTTGQGTLSVYQFTNLVVTPNLTTTGLSEADLSYEWKINSRPMVNEFEVISTERDLNEEIRLRPITGSIGYKLVLTVTDKKNDLNYIMSWPVIVRNNIGEGLLVASTLDNQHTDISHIMSPEVTTDYTGVSVKHQVYSSINGDLIDGLVKQMRYIKFFGVDGYFAITDNSIIRINSLDQTFSAKDATLFFAPYSPIHPQSMSGVYQSDIFIINNRFTYTNLGASRAIGAPYDNEFTVPAQVAVNPNNSNFTYTPVTSINFYDEVRGHFVYLQTILPFGGDTKMYAHPSTAGAFNAGNLPNKQNLAAGYTVDRGFLHVLKDKTSGKTEAYLFKEGTDDVPAPVPDVVIDLSSAPGIGEATKFVIMDDQKVLYYATPTKIYAMMYSTSTPVFEERYTIPAGEQLTTLQVYQDPTYPVSWDPFIATNNRQLIMSTYGTEGKVYILPIRNLGAGNIDVPNIKTFTGFGRITAIGTQK